MADLDDITLNLRRMRREIDQQLESTAASQTVTTSLVSKISELRERSERTTEDARTGTPVTSLPTEPPS